ncbi:MAG: STAS domain-containing protein [Isosphaeraceae bacterium]
MKNANLSEDAVVIQHQGEFIILEISSVIESLDHSAGAILADIVLAPVRAADHPMLIIDLSKVELFGSMFLTVLLRSWQSCVTRGGMMVLCGAGERVRELLSIVRLDRLWPIYATRGEAMSALSSD